MSLFSTTDIDAVPLTNYIAWFLDETNPDFNRVQLPPIQRNSVWNVAQVERLWDSLLRGFPIGSMLLSQRNVRSTARPLFSTQQSHSETEGYFLLDGQQRTRSLLLGFRHNADSRLWIDLNPTLQFDNAEYNDRQYLLRLLTKQQPWGMRSQNPEDKLSEGQKFAVRSKLAGSRRYDYLVNPVQERDDEAVSWPIDAELPVPLDALLTLCGGWQGPFTYPTWQDVCQLLPPHLHAEAPPVATPHFITLMQAIQMMLGKSFDSSTRARSIALLLHQPLLETAPTATQAQDSMEVLFRRVNAGGTRLEGEEMNYSLLKSSWDEAYDLVTNIVTDKTVGYLMPPTGIVMAATRLARRAQSKPADLSPSVPQFRKWLSETNPGVRSPFLLAMQDLLHPADGQSAVFHQTLQVFCSLSLHQEDESIEDIGLPKKLLLAIKPVFYHPVLAWIKDNLTDAELLHRNRLAILRYLMFVLITKPDAAKAASQASKVLGLECTGNDFPDVTIYQQWVQAELVSRMPLPDSIIYSHNTPKGLFQTPDELFGPVETDEQPADPFRRFRDQFWHKSSLLLWFQRAHLARWFKGYNPMSQDAADTPFDYDHIVPYSHIITSGSSLETDLGKADTERIKWLRYLYINSIGNFRAWPYWANRGDSNKCHTQKLHLKTDLEPDSELSRELALATGEDFLNASAIPLTGREQWHAAGGVPRKWPQARREAWQTGVEQRVYVLYKSLFTALRFEEWTQADSKI